MVTDSRVWAGNGVLVIITDTHVVDINNPDVEAANTMFVKRLLKFTFDTFAKLSQEGK